jgi:hypothetical protein
VKAGLHPGRESTHYLVSNRINLPALEFATLFFPDCWASHGHIFMPKMFPAKTQRRKANSETGADKSYISHGVRIFTD